VLARRRSGGNNAALDVSGYVSLAMVAGNHGLVRCRWHHAGTRLCAAVCCGTAVKCAGDG
jgi:hypothetical protein